MGLIKVILILQVLVKFLSATVIQCIHITIAVFLSVKQPLVIVTLPYYSIEKDIRDIKFKTVSLHP